MLFTLSCALGALAIFSPKLYNPHTYKNKNTNSNPNKNKNSDSNSNKYSNTNINRMSYRM